MTCHHPDLGSASDWFKQIFLAVRQIRSASQIWVVIRHQYGISTLVPPTSYRGKTSGGVAKRRLSTNLYLLYTALPSVGKCDPYQGDQ